MRRRTVLSLGAGAMLTACAQALPTPMPTATPAPAALAVWRVDATPVVTGQLFPYIVTIPVQPINPYRTDSVWVVATQGDTQLRSLAFWYQEYDEGALEPIGLPHWRVHLNVPTSGRWELRAEADGRQSPALVLDVGVGNGRGFVRAQGGGFSFDNGAPFIPIGLNLGWSTARGAAVLADYRAWLTDLAANGGTACRIWMASWSFGIEWTDTPLGEYSARLRQAWLLDQVLAMAAERGIVVMLTLLNHGAFSTSTNPEWDANPYNRRNGGPLEAPADFVTDESAQQLFAQRVRYIAARTAASAALWCWEWWNEVNWTPISDAALTPWFTRMNDVLAYADPYAHPITNSWSAAGDAQRWESQPLAIVQHHLYGGDDVVRALNSTRIALKSLSGKRPLLLSEVGWSGGGVNPVTAIEAVHLHNAVWAPLFMGFAGTGMYWWWDTWIAPTVQWTVFRGVSQFFAQQNLANFRPFRPTGFADIALGLRTDEQVLLWVRAATYTAADAQRAALAIGDLPEDWVYTVPMPAPPPLAISGLRDGEYAVSWFDIPQARWGSTAMMTVEDGTGELLIPALVNDGAVRIVRKES
ncbi:MAG: hypothetical protein RLY87_1185 [Chloroflexota bacterium]